MAGIEITRLELTATDLRKSAGKSRDAKASRRMLALALVLEGVDRTRAAESCGMDRQTLRDWVHRYNAEGLAGLSDRWRGARAPRLDPAQMAELAAWVEAGPDPSATRLCAGGGAIWRAGLPRLSGSRCMSAQSAPIWRHWGIAGCRSRPQHPRTDPQAQEAFKKTSARRERRQSRRLRKANPSKSGSRMKRGSASRAH